MLYQISLTPLSQRIGKGRYCATNTAPPFLFRELSLDCLRLCSSWALWVTWHRLINKEQGSSATHFATAHRENSSIFGFVEPCEWVNLDHTCLWLLNNFLRRTLEETLLRLPNMQYIFGNIRKEEGWSEGGTGKVYINACIWVVLCTNSQNWELFKPSIKSYIL